MLVDIQKPAQPTASSFPPIQYRNAERSGASDRSLPVLSNGRDSLAVSLDQARLRKSIFELVRKLLVERFNTASLDPASAKSLLSAVIDRACFEAEPREIRQIEARLTRAFEDMPMEDGINHPAEPIIDEALRSVDGQRVFRWLKGLSLDTARPELAASVLRCLGRRRPGTPAWRAEIVRAALGADDLEMRDAAVQAAEAWGGPEMEDVLRNHAETAPWLRAYIRDVIEDLAK